MSEKAFVFNVSDWLTKPDIVLANLAEGIDQLIGDTASGCVVVRLNGPMSGEETVV